jgi:hypothetical protein
VTTAGKSEGFDTSLFFGSFLYLLPEYRLLLFVSNYSYTIATETLNIAKLQNHFKSKSTFANKDIVHFLCRYNINDS